MGDGSREIREGYQKMTPVEVARFMRREAKRVGYKYTTERQVWEAPHEIHLRGLASLILDELEKIQREVKKDSGFKDHCRWFRIYYKGTAKLLERHAAANIRLCKLLGVDDIGEESRPELDCHEASFHYRNDLNYFHGKMDDFMYQVKKLEGIKKPEDAICLKGVGKAKMKKIMENLSKKD